MELGSSGLSLVSRSFIFPRFPGCFWALPTSPWKPWKAWKWWKRPAGDRSFYLKRCVVFSRFCAIYFSLHGLLEPRAEKDVVRGPSRMEGCSSSNCLEGTSHEAVVELPRSCELAVGAGEWDLAEAVVREGEPLRALGVRPRSALAADGFYSWCAQLDMMIRAGSR